MKTIFNVFLIFTSVFNDCTKEYVTIPHEVENMREKIQRFFYGRYGLDRLNQFILVLALIIEVINLFFRSFVLNGIFYVLILIYMFRILSKNIVARSIENDKYLRYKKFVIRRGKTFQSNIKDREHKVVLCPKCAQMVRLPRKRGKLEVTCPNCHAKFEKRT